MNSGEYVNEMAEAAQCERALSNMLVIDSFPHQKHYRYETIKDTVESESIAMKAVVERMLMILNGIVTVATNTMARMGRA